MVYEYELEMEETYRNSMLKTFKKTLDDGFFPFIIIDTINDKVRHFDQFWSAAKTKGFEVSSPSVWRGCNYWLYPVLKLLYIVLYYFPGVCGRNHRRQPDLCKEKHPRAHIEGSNQGLWAYLAFHLYFQILLTCPLQLINMAHTQCSILYTDVWPLGTFATSYGAPGCEIAASGRCYRGGEVINIWHV